MSALLWILGVWYLSLCGLRRVGLNLCDVACDVICFRDFDAGPWAVAHCFSVAVISEPAGSSSSLDARRADLVFFLGIGEVAGAALAVLRVALGT